MVNPNRSSFSKVSPSVAPEEVLLQITLAFMVFLGFLVSDEVVNKTALSEELNSVGKGLSLILDTPKGEMIDRLNQALLSEQKYILLESWWRLRGEQDLFRLTAFFEDSNSPLEKSAIYELRLDSSFKFLHQISDRLFDDPSGQELNAEVNRLVTKVQEKVSAKQTVYKPARYHVENPSYEHQEARQVSEYWQLSKGELKDESIHALVQEIREDFLNQKQKVEDIQTRAVTRLLQDSIKKWSYLKEEPHGPHIVYLKQAIDEWDKDLPLLPEVKKEFLQASSKSTGRD